MKIDNSIKSLTPGPLSEEVERTPRKAAVDSAATATDSVQISAASAQMNAIEQGFADTPVVDVVRVAELKQAIASGHFKIDAEKVAQRLLVTVQDLILAHKA